MSEFDKLLDELNALGDETQETMSKALDGGAEGADENDERIQAAADAGDEHEDGDGGEGSDAGHDEPDGDEGAEGAGDGDGDEGDEPMGKSFLIELEDGSKVEAFDGTEMMKSLQLKVEQTEQRSTEALEKAIGLIRDQGQVIKSLQETVSRLQNAGRGRKAVVSVADAGSQQLSKSQEISGPEFMSKALDAQKAGRITGLEVSRIEAYMNKGLQIPQDLVTRVIQ